MSQVTISSDLINDINLALPEQKPMHIHNPQYLQTGSVREFLITDSAEITVTFIHEGAGYRNSLGVYHYNINTPPASVSDLQTEIIFPNTSFVNSGGGMQVGNSLVLGTYPPNTKVGFYIVANGWNGSGVSNSKPHYYSFSDFNPEVNSDFRKHLAVLYHPDYENAIMGFEDINRDNYGCDHDFNDLIITASWNPITAVSIDGIIEISGENDSDGDGVYDNNDDYPDDPDKAYDIYFPGDSTYGLLAYEDMYPSQGDYDFNDVVVRYKLHEIRDANLNIKKIDGHFIAIATGAEQSNAFSINLGNITSAIDSATLSLNGAIQNTQWYRNTGSELILDLFPNLKGSFDDPTGNLINTEDSKSHYQGDSVHLSIEFTEAVPLTEPPYDPFIYRVASPSIEVHLPDYAPTSNFSFSLFGQQDDDSDPNTNRYFRNANHLPWAIHTTTSWNYPIEKRDISLAYPNFNNWLASEGRTHLDWNTNGRVVEFIYQGQ
jgi:LruC domain-containing protein